MVGALLGYKLSAADPPRPFESSPWLRRVRWAVPRSLERANEVGLRLERAERGHVNLVMEDLGVDSVFEGEILAVRRTERGLGLSREMLRVSMEVAESLGCQTYYAGVSGIYSQRIFQDAGFQVLREVNYADMKDERGRTLLEDIGEHSKVQFVFFNLRDIKRT